jgi:2-iminobutanoate/2-iminopropanoate deaminase
VLEVAPAQGLPEPRGTYSHAVRVPAGRDLLFVSGLTSRDEKGQIVAPRDAAGQARQVFANLSALLAQSGATLADVVRATYYVVHMSDRDAIEAVRRELFDAAAPPAATMVEVFALNDPALVVEVDVVAALP